MKNIKINQFSLIGSAILLFALAVIISGLGATVFAAPPNDEYTNAQVLSGIHPNVIGTTVGATPGLGDPHGGVGVLSVSVWYKWTAPMTRVMTFSTNRTSGYLTASMDVLTGSIFEFRTACSSNAAYLPHHRAFCRMMVTKGTTYYIYIDAANHDDQRTFQLEIKPSFEYQGADYDNDGTTDVSIFRPSIGTWYVSNSSNDAITAFHWGANGDIPVVSSDLNDGRNDIAVYRPTTGFWYSSSSTFNPITNWGTPGDVPVPASYAGGAYTDTAVYRPSTGVWSIRYGANNYGYYVFGTQGDIPVPGHYSKDPFADIAVFRPSNGTWYFTKRVGTNKALDTLDAVQFGTAGDKPVPGDYDGDGVLDVAVFRPSNGFWYVLRSSDGQFQAFNWGLETDIPTTGDFDGDGLFDYAVFRPSTGIWYICRSSDKVVVVKQFGANGDIPVTANRTF